MRDIGAALAGVGFLFMLCGDRETGGPQFGFGLWIVGAFLVLASYLRPPRKP
jgi:hypothetical protein